MNKSFNDIISNLDNIQFLYKTWASVGDKKSTVALLNDKFDTEFAYETWSRYLSTLIPIYEAGGVTNEDITEALVKLKIQKQQTNVEKNHLNKMYRHFGRQDLILDKFKESFESIQHEDYKFKGDRTKISGDYTFDLPHVFLSDFHFKNEKNKVAEVLKDVEETIWEQYGTKCVIVLTGDSVQGVLRHGDLFEENWNPVQQTCVFAKVFCDNISPSWVEKVVVIPGNHGEIRVSDYKGLKNPNHEQYIATIIGTTFGEDFVEYTDYYYGGSVEVFHGHQFRGKTKIQAYAKQDPSTFFVHAHLHNFSIIDNVVSLPALSEPNEYEMSLGFEDNVPRYVIIDQHFRVQVRDMSDCSGN